MATLDLERCLLNLILIKNEESEYSVSFSIASSKQEMRKSIAHGETAIGKNSLKNKTIDI